MGSNYLRLYKDINEYNEKKVYEEPNIQAIEETNEIFFPKKIISFKIIYDNETFNCECEDGMTFNEFANSSFNNLNEKCTNNLLSNTTFNGKSYQNCAGVWFHLSLYNTYDSLISGDYVINDGVEYYLIVDESMLQ